MATPNGIQHGHTNTLQNLGSKPGGRLRSLAIAAVATVALSGGVAAVADTKLQDKYSFSYVPAELSSQQSLTSLHKRIRRVARDNCPSYGVSRELKAGAQCRAEVAADLVSRINNPALTALHVGKPQREVAAN